VPARPNLRRIWWIDRGDTKAFDGRVWLYCCLGVIALVSIHDAMLIVTNHEIINDVEQNPVGTFLLQLQGGQVWLFVFAKLLGTSLVTTCLVVLYEYRKRLGLLVATVISIFQCLLLTYLTFF
jgi:hypothetical protein